VAVALLAVGRGATAFFLAGERLALRLTTGFFAPGLFATGLFVAAFFAGAFFAGAFFAGAFFALARLVAGRFLAATRRDRLADFFG